MKKQFYLIISALLLNGFIVAQTPQAFKYQTVARNSNGTLIQNQQVAFRIDILQGGPSGNLVYRERHTALTNDYGLANLQIGNGTVLIGNFTAIDWSTGQMFMNILFDPNGGYSFINMGTIELLSVPYALYAKSADIDGSETKVTAGTNVTVTGTGVIANPYVINSIGGRFVGGLFGGGVVFWVDHNLQYGLICSMVDLSTSQAWSNVTDVEIGDSAQSHWNGPVNSLAIVGQPQHVNSAAQLSLEYTNAGYGTGIFSDWYLPSPGEAIHLTNNLYEVQKALDTDGNPATTAITTNNYWSSSEYSSSSARAFCIGNSNCNDQVKSTPCYVRAVRAF